jgi:hypothetical protein
MEPCTQCHDVGWVLDANISAQPITAELLACSVPDCHASGREIAVLSVYGGSVTC